MNRNSVRNLQRRFLFRGGESLVQKELSNRGYAHGCHGGRARSAARAGRFLVRGGGRR